jgi:hypothetical protein
MYFDAQYTLPELAYKANWGHSAPQVGIEIALREKIGHVLFSHHDPTARTENIIELRRQTNDYFQSLMREAKENNESISQLVWDFAYEGQEIKLV